MDTNSPYSFYINFEAVLKQATYKKAQKEIEKVLSNVQDKVEKVEEEIQKKHNKTTSGMIQTIKKVAKTSISGAKALGFFYGKMNLFVGALGYLSQLKFEEIQDLKVNLDSIGENAQYAYKYLSASDKLIGVSKSGLIDEINEIAKSKQSFKSYGIAKNPMWAMFGARPEDAVDTVLLKFRQKIKQMPDSNAKIFSEKMGFENIYKIAKLNDDEFKKLTNINAYTANNIKKIEQSAKQTKLLTATAKDLKDNLIITFSPIVVSMLKTITDFLNSKYVQTLFRAVEGLVEDLEEINKLLNGWLFKGLFGLLVIISGGLTLLASPIIAVVGIITLLVSLIQDFYNGLKAKWGWFGGGKDAKDSMTGRMLDWIDRKMLGSGMPTLQNTTSNINTNNNNNQATQNNNIVINVNGNNNNSKTIARDTKSEIEKLINKNNNKINNMNYYRS